MMKSIGKTLILLFLFVFLFSTSAASDDVFQANAVSAEFFPLSGMETTPSAKVPIIMYHKISKNNSLVGKFGITPTEFENDLRYLQDNGYETVGMEDLIAFVKDGRPLPEKPVVLTFDDGNYSDYLYAYPLLKKYQKKAVLSIIVKTTDRYSSEGRADINYPNLVWEQIREMVEDGSVEIQNHTYNLHGRSGSAKLRREGVEGYRKRLDEDLSASQVRINEILGVLPTTFTYPLGAVSKESYEVIQSLGFSASLTCCNGISTITQGDPQSLFLLSRCIRSHGHPISEILNKIMPDE